MMNLRLLGGVACAIATLSQSALAVPVSGQGTWESTLQGRDLDGNPATFEAYYDTTLDITWLADANYAKTSGFDSDGLMTWAAANAWAAGLDVNGITGWRLPTNTPINGSSYQMIVTTNASSDLGYAGSAGWVNGSGNPVSEMGHMYYVTLGNLGLCPPDGGDGDPSTCDNSAPPGWGLTNTGPFSNVQSSGYWSGSTFVSTPWFFDFGNGSQSINGQPIIYFAWAVRSGDVSAVPVPAAVWLFGSGLMGLLGIARRKR